MLPGSYFAYFVTSRALFVGCLASLLFGLNVTLANGIGAPDVPANVALFSLKNPLDLRKNASTDEPFELHGKVYGASMFLHGTPCDSALTISAGSSITCNVAVSLDGDVTVTDLEYQTPGALAEANGLASPTADKRTVSAVVDAPVCTPCGLLCTDTAADESNCGACDKGVPRGGACTSGMGTVSSRDREPVLRGECAFLRRPAD